MAPHEVDGPDHLSAGEVLALVADVTMEPPSQDSVLTCLEAADALVPAGELLGAEELAGRAVEMARRARRPDLEGRA